MIPLRDYQWQALKELRSQYSNLNRRALLVSPTGSGKTRMGVEAVIGAVKKGRHILWLAHRRELIKQASLRLTREGLSEHGILLANAEKYRKEAPVQVASVDTLRARNLTPKAELLVWDEAHHCAADTWSELHRRYPDAWHLGLTATPERHDGKPLRDFFDTLVVAATVFRLTKLGFLVPCRIETPKTRLLANQMAQTPVDAWQEKANRKSTIVYVSTIEETKETVRTFQQVGVPAAFLEADTKPAKRDEILKKFAKQEILVLCNVAILTEGWDCPSAEVCLIARRVQSKTLWLQMVGRILRPSPGKTQAFVLDLTGNVHEHGHPEDARTFSLHGGIKLVRSQLPGASCCLGCGRWVTQSPCRRCGQLASPQSKEITGQELRPYEKVSQQELQQLKALTEFALEQGFQPGWIRYEFRKRHQIDLPKEVYYRIYRQFGGSPKRKTASWDPEPR